MSDDERPEDEPTNVLVFRNGVGQPVAVPEDIVVDAERPYRAYKAHLGGKDWATIAEQEGYPSASSAAYDVDRYMEEARSMVTARSQKQLLDLNVARLDYMLSQVWPGVEAGMLTAIKEARGIIMDQSKTVVAMAAVKDDSADEIRRTVVIYGEQRDDKDSYIQQLQRAAGDDTPSQSPGQPDRPASGSTVIMEPPDTKE